MAQRDEGLDKLEVFIAGAAEARAALQREAEALAGAEDEMEELEERFDREMKDLGTTAREFDARYGPTYELLWTMSHAGLIPYIGAAAFQIGYLVGHGHRQGFIAAADALESAYEQFLPVRYGAVEALEKADAATSAAFTELLISLHALGTGVAPLAEGVAADLGGLRAQLDAHLEVGS